MISSPTARGFGSGSGMGSVAAREALAKVALPPVSHEKPYTQSEKVKIGVDSEVEICHHSPRRCDETQRYIPTMLRIRIWS
jgi:hypothetical protein